MHGNKRSSRIDPGVTRWGPRAHHRAPYGRPVPRFIAEPQHKKWFDSELSSASGVPTSSVASAPLSFRGAVRTNLSSALCRCARESHEASGL